MKNHRFPWLRNRTTDNRKCEKARNIKEKRTIEMFSTVSKQLVALRSSPRDKQIEYYKEQFPPKTSSFRGFLFSRSALICRASVRLQQPPGKLIR